MKYKNLVAGQIDSLLKKVAPKYEGMPVALSGGIDSSTLAAFLSPKTAISVQLPDSKHNEIEYAKKVVSHLKIPEHIVVEYTEDGFEDDLKTAVLAIGRPIPHFNIVPLFQMYRKLFQEGYKDLVLGDGPDEVMCGYGRDLIFKYLYKVYDFPAFKNYKGMIDKILPPIEESIKKITGMEGSDIQQVDIDLMRPDMDDMSNGIAKYFGIINHRPYQDNQEIDDFMRDLPIEEKIHDVEYGKYALRLVAEKYLPEEIAWRKEKVGGPLYSPNMKMGWFADEGEYGKKAWIQYQQDILDGKR